MGLIPMKGVYESGDNCLDCWDPDNTPLYVLVAWAGITWGPGDAPIRQSAFILKQRAPCEWFVNVLYNFGPPFGLESWESTFNSDSIIHTSGLRINLDIQLYFLNTGPPSPPHCTFGFTNRFPPGTPGGGIAIVQWGGSINEAAYEAQPHV